MESLGVELPFALMANNDDEKTERFMRMTWFMLASFVAPVITMPFINKQVLKRVIKDIKPEEKAILRVSKKYLTKGADYMIEGFNKTKGELEKNKKFEGVSEHFDNVLERYKGKEEQLREKLIKAHQQIFSLDFAVASVLAVINPWVMNYVTEKRTKRVGYVGEFKMAGKDYTDKTSEKHQKIKNVKMAISIALPLVQALLIPRMLAKSMLKPAEKLGSMGKFFKNKAHLFDYTGAIYASKAAYFGIMAFGDFPSYMLACRDKHELKLRFSGFGFVLATLFACEPVLNNLAGRFSDWKFGTALMNRKGFENAGFLKNLLMPVKSLKDINMSSASKLTKKAALGMYWGNFALTTTVLGFGLPFILNKVLKKDVTEAQKKFLDGTSKKSVDMSSFLQKIQPDSDKIFYSLKK